MDVLIPFIHRPFCAQHVPGDQDPNWLGNVLGPAAEGSENSLLPLSS